MFICIMAIHNIKLTPLAARNRKNSRGQIMWEDRKRRSYRKGFRIIGVTLQHARKTFQCDIKSKFWIINEFDQRYRWIVYPF